MADTVESGVKLTLDSSDFDSKIDDILSRLDELEGGTYSATVEVDTSEADSTLQGLENDEVDISATVTTDDSSDSTLEKIHALADIGAHAWNLVVNIAGTAVDFFNTVSDFAVKPLLDLDQAVATFSAHTGDALPNARELFSNILYDDLGTDITQVEQVAEAAHQLGDPLDEATRAALTLTKAFTDQDPVQALNAMDAMVKTGLAPDFKTASDLLVTAFQNGANKGGDLLTAIQQNAGAIKDLGLTGPESLQLLTNALQNGATNATSVIQGLEIIKKNITAQTTAGKGPALDVLAALNIPNPITSGTGWTDDFFKSVADAIKALPVSDERKQQMFQALAGGKAGQKDYEWFFNLDAATGVFDNVAGAGDDAATAIDDSLTGAVDDFMLAAQQAATDFLSSDQIDLPGKIAALKSGLQDALGVLQGGGSLADALTVGLKPIGFDDEFQKLESMFGNFIIELLNVVAQLQDITGHGDQAKATRGTIAGLEKQQLPFDLKIANPDDVGNIVATAVARGLGSTDISDGMAKAVHDLINSGDFQQAQQLITALGKGGEITFDVTDPVAKKLLEGQGLDTTFKVPITPEMTPEDIQKTIDDTVKTFGDQGITIKGTVIPSIDQTTLDNIQYNLNQKMNAAGNTLGASPNVGVGSKPAFFDPDKLDDLAKKTADATTATTNQTTATTAQTDATTVATTATTDQTTAQTDLAAQTAPATQQVQKAGDAFDELTGHAEPTTGHLQLLGDRTDDVGASAIVTSGSLMDLNGAIQTVGQTAATVKPAAGAAATTTPVTTPTHAGGGIFSGMSWVGENGPELISSDTRTAVLNNKTAKGLLQALTGAPFMASGGYAGGGGKSVVLNQTNIVNNEAIADSLGYRTAQQVRGM